MAPIKIFIINQLNNKNNKNKNNKNHINNNNNNKTNNIKNDNKHIPKRTFFSIWEAMKCCRRTLSIIEKIIFSILNNSNDDIIFNQYENVFRCIGVLSG